MFSKLLIANRGEIAVRIIRACREMDIRTVAVFSEADRAALHVRLAEEAYSLGPTPASESYLNLEKLLAATKRSGAQAIHPGYGFLSENPAFAEACEAAGIGLSSARPVVLSGRWEPRPRGDSLRNRRRSRSSPAGARIQKRTRSAAPRVWATP